MRAGDEGTTRASTEESLSSMTKAELEALALELEIEGVSTSQTKTQMIETILANL